MCLLIYTRALLSDTESPILRPTEKGSGPHQELRHWATSPGNSYV